MAADKPILITRVDSEGSHSQDTFSSDMLPLASGLHLEDADLSITVESGHKIIIGHPGFPSITVDAFGDVLISGNLYAEDFTSSSGLLASEIYVDGEIASLSGYVGSTFLNLSGGALTGPLTLSANPTLSGQASNKGYVDSAAAAVSGGYIAADLVLQSLINMLAEDAVSSGQASLVSYSGFAEGTYVNASGDTMTGFLTLVGDPTISGHAVTKQYSDNNLVGASGTLQSGINSKADLTYVDTQDATLSGLINGKLSLSGGTLSGPLTLAADPTISGHAATKQYVDVTAATLSGAYIMADSVLQALIYTVAEDAVISGEASLTAYSGFAETRFVNTSGDSLTGFLTLVGAPTAPLHAATKQYVDDQVIIAASGDYVSVSGDTMEGYLTLHADPVNSGHASTKQYVDTISGNLQGQINAVDVTAYSGFAETQFVNVSGDTVAGPLYLAASITSGTQAVHKDYVDNLVVSTSGDLVSYVDTSIQSYSGTAESTFVNVSGDTLTGFLTLHSDPTLSGHSVTKQYVDSVSGSLQSQISGLNLTAYSGYAESAFINTSGDSMVGALLLSGAPSISLEAANKGYVDGEILNISGSLTSYVTSVSGDLQSQIDDIDLVSYSGFAETQFVNTSGDSLTGFLTLHSDPVLSGQAATKQYVDSQDTALSGALSIDIQTAITSYSGFAEGRFVNTSGDSMLGALLLSGSPSASLEATPKTYVDSEIVSASTALSGYINSVSGNLQSDIDAIDLISYSGFAETQFVNTSGDVLSGFLTLHADPTNSGHASTKQYVDLRITAVSGNLLSDIQDEITTYSGFAETRFINTSGDSMVGPLLLSGSPSSTLEAANKGYVDTEIASASTALSGYVNSVSGNLQSQIDNIDILAYSGYAESQFVNVSGDTLTGFLTLHSDPSLSGHAATKQYVDLVGANAAASGSGGDLIGFSGYAESAFVNTSGDSMTGFLTLNADPVLSGHSATKQYVDTVSGTLQSQINLIDIATYSGFAETQFVNTSGDTMTGFLTLHSSPSLSGHAATKFYVDTVSGSLQSQISALDISTFSGYAEAAFVNTSGDSMAGSLLLSGAPSQALEAANKGYVDTEISNSSAALSGYIDSVSGNLQADIDAIDLVAYSGFAESRFVNTSGDSMTGFLTLHSNPTLSGHAVTKQYVDSSILTASGDLYSALNGNLTTYSGFAESQFVNTSGDTVTGFLTLDQAPQTSGHASNKGYVDSELISTSATLMSTFNSALSSYSGVAEVTFVNTSGDAMSGFLTLHADPTASGHAVTKQYVDEQRRVDYVLVKELSDLPTPVGSIIYLAPDTTYEFNGNIDFSTNSVQVASGVTLKGNSHFTDTLTYGGTGSFILVDKVPFEANNLTFYAPTAGSQVFLCSGVNAANSGTDVRLEAIDFGNGASVNKVGTFVGGRSLEISACHFHHCTSGIVFSGSFDRIAYFGNLIQDNNPGFYALSFTGTGYQSVQISDNHFDLVTGEAAIFAPSDLTISAGGVVSENIFTGSGTALSGGIATTDGLWLMKNNTGLIDSRSLGFIKFDANATATTIADSTNYFLAAGTNSSSTGERFNVVTNNRITYTGTLEPTATFSALVTGAVSCASANETLRVALYKFTSANSTFTNLGETEVRISTANQSVPFAYNDLVSLSTNDYLEVRVRNLTDTTSITMEYMQFRVVKGN